MTDENGYAFTLTFIARLGTPTSDVTNSLPGETEIKLPYGLEYWVKNTTPGRVAPLDVLRPLGLPLRK